MYVFPFSVQKLQKGFTIVEFILVIALMALVALLTVQSLHPYLSKNRLQGAADTLVSDIREIQQSTLTHQQSYSLVFTYPNMYSVWQDTNLMKEVVLPAGIELGAFHGLSTGPSISFLYNGAASDAGSIELTDPSRGLTIIVELKTTGSVLWRFQ